MLISGNLEFLIGLANILRIEKNNFKHLRN
jgi:hypothetical protein